jgi:signal peptidase I
MSLMQKAAQKTAQPAHRTSDGPLVAVQSMLHLIVVAIFIVAFSAQPFQIPSGSMEPTLRIGDFLLVDKQLVTMPGPLPRTNIQHGDIIVFHYPIDPALLLVKRVIGVPGDRIRLRAGLVFRNGQPLEESYAVYRPGPPDGFRDNFPRMVSAEPGIDSRWWIEMRGRIDNGELVVPPGRYFVLGDNRNNSEDSRYWGFVPASAVVGKPFVIYFSVRQTEPGGPFFTAQAPDGGFEERLIDRLAAFARWDRTLRIVH